MRTREAPLVADGIIYSPGSGAREAGTNAGATRKLVGPANIGSPELLDTHRPDAFRVNRFELNSRRGEKQAADSKERAIGKGNQSGNGNLKSEIRNSKFGLGFRVFRPPLRAIVQAEKGLSAGD